MTETKVAYEVEAEETPRAAPPDFTPDVMTVEDLAAYLQVSRKSVYVMAQTAEVPAVKVAGQWRFFKPVVDRWLWVMSQRDYKGPALTPDADLPAARTVAAVGSSNGNL